MVSEAERTYSFKEIRFIDLFCGIGGFRIAFEKIGGKCVFSSDYDKFSQQTDEANFGGKPHGDIHAVDVAFEILSTSRTLKSYFMLDSSEVYIFSDQPTTCPVCSSRTAFFRVMPHDEAQSESHKCANKKCNYEFLMQMDEDFENGNLYR